MSKMNQILLKLALPDYLRDTLCKCRRIGNDLSTDKPRFRDVYRRENLEVKQETLDWLANQNLIVLSFMT